MLGFTRKSPEHSGALERIRDWTCKRFNLAPDSVILVAEVACTLPGCAPIETVIAFWTGKGRHHFKVFKPATDVVLDDLPPSWMKNALIVDPQASCECC